MSLHQLDIAPRDVSAGALGLLLDGPAPTPLAQLRLPGAAGASVVLGVLGASHVVAAEVRGHRLTEEVSCDAVAAGGRPLPAEQRSGGYAFTAATTTATRAELDATAARLRARAAGDPAWLCGAFPGAADALTALTAQPLDGGWAWQTWHLYPAGDSGELVTTRTRWVP
ncbi:DUF2617 family protein [Blastococcus sp. MG754426]|uniref:DUF2617 family protein n=1 Tax=unclassified Blastococcus TaxID=2619396 RepID=UPI001EEFE286|nr:MULTISPECIES: DUF2617 family protein [unclassified Blastococcus]MCF6507443.1 DUF2617 family protein [Blastococcus sp. MG754426]MCF6512009.1 DUF2617 family protein [Blastococcus sp. MG754427]